VAKLQAEQEAMCENSRVAAKSDSEEETVAVVQMVEDDAGKEMLSQAQQEDEGISKLLKRCADVGTRSSWHVSILRAGVIVVPEKFKHHILQCCHDYLGDSHLNNFST